ncbi:MAG: PhzF family phenazine biosynthesis protein [Candidatus Rokubacteria bacterium]|nr:PhzF family phenazine biosynthesis protein [Candidatus Rokubacteria bacterium]
MSRDYRLLHVDVFTERPLAGNPLAVVVDARGIADDEMLAVAREMNLSETAFVLPPARSDCVARVRIFTPGRELPFAGHPTVGTAWVLATTGLAPRGATRFALEEGIGPVEVELEGDAARPSFVWMRHRDATFGAEVKDRAGVAASLGLAERDLVPGAPIQTGSTGNPFLYVPLRDAGAVDRAALDPRRLEQAVPEMTTLGVFVLAPDADPAARRVYSRMFAPAHGVAEDPATGSASGALGAYLALHRLVAPAPEMRIVSEQGTKMGHQSFVHVALTLGDGAVTNIRVGGAVVPVLDARLTLP